MATQSFIKTIGGKGLLSDYNTVGKKLQTELTAGNNVTIADNVISSNQVFVATYGTTTYQEIKDAYNAGNVCVCKDGNNLFNLSIINDNYALFSFANGWAATMYVSTCYSLDNNWVRGASVYQKKLTFDTTPTAGSNNPVTSDGINAAIRNKATQFSLGSTASRVYTMFARMSDTNTDVNVEAQVILSSAGNYGLHNQGTWEIIVSNRGSTASSPKAYMTVRCINAVKAMSGTVTEPTFGYYIDTTNHYIYFGIYSPPYRGQSRITALVNNNVTLQDFGDSTTAPTGWTTVTPTGVSSAETADKAFADGRGNNIVNTYATKTALDSRVPAPTSTTGTQVLKCINGVIQWVNE